MIDLLRMRALLWGGEDLGAEVEIAAIPGELAAAAAAARARLVETVAERDEGLLAVYLENPDPPAAEVLAAVRRLTIARTVTPVLCGSALRNKGVQPLLDAVVDLLPSPADVPPVEGTNPKTGAIEHREPRIGAPLCALAFKVMTAEDRRLTYFRVYSGRIRAGDTVLNTTRSAGGEGRPALQDARQQARAHRRGGGRRHRGRRRAQERRHRRHAHRPGASAAARADALHEPGDRPRGRAAQQRRHRQARAGARQTGGGGPDARGADRPRHRPEHHLGNGRAAPRDRPRPDRPRVPGPRALGPPAGHPPRDDLARGRARGRVPARGRRADHAGGGRAADQAARARRGDAHRVRAARRRPARSGRRGDHRGRRRLLRRRHALGLPGDRPRGAWSPGFFSAPTTRSSWASRSPPRARSARPPAWPG